MKLPTHIKGGVTASKDNRRITLNPTVNQLLSDQHVGRPVWIRSPKSGVEFYCGFSRSKLYEEANRGNIRSVSIREPGQVKGTRLFHLDSILQYIERCEAETRNTELDVNGLQNLDGGLN